MIDETLFKMVYYRVRGWGDDVELLSGPHELRLAEFISFPETSPFWLEHRIYTEATNTHPVEEWPRPSFPYCVCMNIPGTQSGYVFQIGSRFRDVNAPEWAIWQCFVHTECLAEFFDAIFESDHEYDAPSYPEEEVWF